MVNMSKYVSFSWFNYVVFGEHYITTDSHTADNLYIVRGRLYAK